MAAQLLLPPHQVALPTTPPDVIEFVCSDQYLGRSLYPRQATLLKAIFLQLELMTQYDYDVLGDWAGREFTLPPAENWDIEKPYRFVGQWGIQPDILERIDINRREGRKWFREVLAVIGRRGGKGYIGALAGAYVLWHYLCLHDPQAHYAIDRDKRLATLVFAGKKEQARQNQWRDLINVLIGAPCFQPYISQSLGESLTMHSKVSLGRGAELASQGIKTSMDLASFEVLPKEATPMAGRGVAGNVLFFDEMAHVVATGASRGADELYDSATPSLDQFGTDGFIYAGSSPWQMLGKYYELVQQALEVEYSTLEPVHPDKLIVQLTSWDIYEDWDRAHKIQRIPATDRTYHFLGGPEPDPVTTPALGFHYIFTRAQDDSLVPVRSKTFDPIARPIQVYDAHMARLERANPETFAVERRSRWAASLDNYLNPVLVDRMFEPYMGRTLQMAEKGILSRVYVAHGDPSKSGANFGWAIAHAEGPDHNGFMHVVFDKIHFWAPWSFDDGQIDYVSVEKEILRDIKNFRPELVTFDQFSSGPIMSHLRQGVVAAKLPKRVTIDERTATAPRNWQVAETFKTALGLDLIHMPYFEQTELECKFLQVKGNKVDHPTIGPVQSKDVYDAVSNCVWSLIGEQMEVFLRSDLSRVSVQPAGQQMAMGAVGSQEANFDREIFDALGSANRRRRPADSAYGRQGPRGWG